jgi:8-oxo-dGTP pyrophosphatase MutT (NUDIX family)
MRQSTLCFLVQREKGEIKKICLAMKKRGLGVGRFNGVGGKVQEGETIEEGAKREALEEVGVILQEIDPVAELTFLFPHRPEWDQVSHVFLCRTWEGIPQESEEMKPRWFDINEIPYDTMWSDDIYWLPPVLQGKHLQGKFVFNTQDQLMEHKIRILP